MSLADGTAWEKEYPPSTDYPDNNPKTAVGLTKPRMSLTPSTALVHLALAFADGAAKYGPYNWREKKVSSTVYVDAMLRHIADWFDGENVAPDSGVHHLAHVMACCAIIIDAETVGNLNDNRPPKAPTAELIRTLTKHPENKVETPTLQVKKYKQFPPLVAPDIQWPLPVELEDEGTPL